MDRLLIKSDRIRSLVSGLLTTGAWLVLPLCLALAEISYAAEIESESDNPLPTSAFAARHKIEFYSLLMFDAANVGSPYTNDDRSNETDLRRARIGVSADVSKQISTDITLNLDEDDSEIQFHELMLRFKPKKDHRVDVGLIKQPFGLENSTSSRRLLTLERSMATNAFAPGRAHGLTWSATPSNHLLALGAFADPDVDNVYDITGRTTFAPIKDKKSVLHFGMNASYRDNDSTEYRIRDGGILQDGRNFFKSGKYQPESITTVGIEAAWAHKSFIVKSEWFKQSLNLASNAESNNPSFTGGYLTAGYVVNGGRRKYSNGKFGKVTNLKKGPAIEVVAAIGQINTIFADKGDDGSEITIGVNAHVSKNVRIAGQVQHLAITEADGDKDSGTSVLLRLQIDLNMKPGRS